MASFDPQRPNVVLILTDDQGPWAMGCAGNAEIITPNLDELAATGTRMANFHCASPVCSPARASLLTGQMPSAHGVHDWISARHVGADGVDFLAGQRSYTDDLSDAGYRLGLCGKWHLGANDQPRPGFVRWLAHDAGGGPYYGAPLHDENGPVEALGYVTDVFTDAAVQFIQSEADQSEPFYLSLHYTAPHSPWTNSHPKQFTDLYADCEFASVPQGVRHPWARTVDGVQHGAEPDTRAALQGYFGAVSAVDAGVGRVLAALDDTSLRSSTVVIFTSDNGFNTGHHGIWGKGNGTFPQNMYNESVTVPFIISQPGRIAAGRVRDQLLSAYDLAPTIRQLCGATEPTDSRRPGRSFVPLLRDGGVDDQWREAVVVADEYGPVRMIRSREWKYVHRYPYGPHELYHLAGDPAENTNLAEDPGQADRVTEFRNQLAAWFAAYSRHGMDGATLPVTGFGQTQPLTAPGDPLSSFTPAPYSTGPHY
ncbi:MAG: sulfatase-like hydrolase/transferase [Beutenbergiaceae bacterium]